LQAKPLEQFQTNWQYWLSSRLDFTLGFGWLFDSIPFFSSQQENTTLPEYQAHKQVSPSEMMGRQRWMSESTTEVYTSWY
jgi:hypothetical protein